MQNLLSGPAKKRSHEVMNEVQQFQEDIPMTLFNKATQQVKVEYVAQELCEERGLRPDGDGYQVTEICRGCGRDRTLDFN